MRAWRERELAGDRIVIGPGDSVKMIFGLGPAHVGKSPEERMVKILDRLTPELLTIRWGEQVHGCVVRSPALTKDRKQQRVCRIGPCDALITSDAGLGLVVWTADCVPILLHGDHVVAAVHAGWRGTAEDVTAKVVRRFESDFSIPPSRLSAALGPAISGPRYPVGPEVIDALRSLGVEESRWLDKNHVDLRGFLEARLESCGIPPSAITTSQRCTASSTDLASYRRDGDAAGRQWSLIYRPAEGCRRPLS